MALGLLARGASAQTLDEIVGRAVLALGGAERLRAVSTRVTTGTISFDGSPANPFTLEQKRPNRLHMEIFFPTGLLRRVFDGEKGWQRGPFAEGEGGEPLSPEETLSIGEQAEFDDPLLDWQTRGSRIELLGKEPVAGRPAFRLRVTLRSGLVQDVFLDALTYRKVRWEGARPVNGRTTVFESSFSDYRTVNGLSLPFRIDSRANRNEGRQEIVITRVELNAPIGDARFSLPRAKP
jgi:hypothetical protein